MRKKLLTLMLLFAVSLTLFGCSTAKDSQTSKNDATTDKVSQTKGDKVLRLGDNNLTESIDPNKDWIGWVGMKVGLGETLFELDKDYKIVPKLAQSYENVDPTTWNIKLKENLTFSNGEKVTGEKVANSLKRTIEMNENAKTLEGSEITADGNVVTIKTKTPIATCINELVDPQFIIVDTDALDEVDKNPICTGPYKVESFTPEEEIVLVANENYWGGKVGLDKIEVKSLPETSTRQMALQSGEIDVAPVDIDSVDIFSKDTEHFNLDIIPTSRVYMIYANTAKLPDANQRKAIFSTIDRETIANDLLKGAVTVARGPFSEDLPFGSKGLDIVEYDPQAKVDGTFDLLYYERLNIPKIATELQSEFTKAGLVCNARQHENYKYLQSGDYGLGMYGLITLRIGDPYAFLQSTFSEKGTGNFNGFKDEEVEKLLKDMEVEFNQDKRNELSRQIIQKALNHNMHYFIGNVGINMVSSKKVQNLLSLPYDYRIIDKDTTIQ